MQFILRTKLKKEAHHWQNLPEMQAFPLLKYKVLYIGQSFGANRL
nr:MAG TPA: hypothetical protein [Caudoviricetes sp.]